MTVTLHPGRDTREILDEFEPGSVDLIACSPPFLALRNYGTGHQAEIGQEANPAAFLDTLLDLTDQFARVLAPHGSIAIELGDTYSAGTTGSGLAHYTDDRGNPRAMRDTTFSGANTRNGSGPGWPLAKSLTGIPTLYAWSLAYGRNLLTGQPCTQWIVRNIIVWARPNPAVGALGDKVRPAVSYITVVTRSPRRWFDLDAARTEPKRESVDRGLRARHNSAGAPPLDYWTDTETIEPGDILWELPTAGSSLAHYAMWPPTLADRLVRLMCPPEGCVLDPFAGTGTTCAVAQLAGRDSIGIDLNPNLADLYPRRLEECRKKLHGVEPEIAGQMSLLEVAG